MNLSLQQRIDKIFDHLYAESKIKNPESISYEFSKILHTGLYIEREYKISPAFQDYFPVEGIFNSKNEIKLLQNDLRLKYLEMNKTWQLFDKAEKIFFSDDDIFYICSNLFDIKLTDKKSDILGDAIEIFRNYTIKSLGGQFFTDSSVTNLALEIINYSPLDGEKFIDICSGTGGFILSAINKTKQILQSKNILDESHLANLTINNISGKEIDKTITDAANRNIQTRIGVKYQYVENIDSLRLPNSYENLFDCIATNPPFGTKTTVKDMKILENYELTNQRNNYHSPTSPDILFLEKNIRLLKPETGRLAIVLPYQILSGPQMKKIRQWILKKCIIIAVIDLPPETFQPHTGTKTSLLIVKKRKKEDTVLHDINYNIFMSRPNWIGHDRRGNPVFIKNIDGSISEEILCDFQIVKNDWINYSKGKQLHSDISFVIKAKEIIDDENMRMNALYHSCSETYDFYNNYVPLKNIVKNIFYPGRFKRNYVSNNCNAVPFLGGSNITEHIISTKKYISRNDPHIEQLIVHEGWILITRSGTTGIVSIVPKEWDGYAISEHVIRIIPDASKENPFFLYAYLQTRSAQEQISKGVFGSVIDEINPELIGNIKIPKDIDMDIKHNIIAAIGKYDKCRNISIAVFRQAVSLIDHIL